MDCDVDEAQSLGGPTQAAPSPAADCGTPVLRVDGLGFRYGARMPWLFRDLAFTVREGEILSILGPNARGKTTLLKNLAGILKPVAGSITVDVPSSYVPQDHGATSSYLVEDMVLMGRTRMLGAFRSPGDADREAARAAMKRVGIARLAGRSYAALSGGQRQLVLIARAVASEARLLILDEPASALDLHNQARVLHVLGELADLGMAVVMTTHHPDHALHCSRNTLLLFGEHDAQWGATTSLLTASTLSAVYRLPIDVHALSTPSGTRWITVPDLDGAPLVSHIAPRNEDDQVLTTNTTDREGR
ncbi:ABC transporter ATP-binding protein [Gordonia hydrophobica]|uniref:ABC transporter ATP-binding protein n=1 Tax=Gordonia hydrophobica TaxID=40516 RepID=A0ABZ2U373_9ACTN|nr:ABC transporter ATP-binding protein [Gordonia hydrophobica]MBM7367319.1 iron complex transport system ATP-binding protein [Gordonia hydrophobica]